MTNKPLSVVVLISGRGSNMATLIQAQQSGRLNIRVSGVISSRKTAAGLKIAEQAGIPTAITQAAGDASHAELDQALIRQISAFEPELVVLGGYIPMGHKPEPFPPVARSEYGAFPYFVFTELKGTI